MIIKMIKGLIKMKKVNKRMNIVKCVIKYVLIGLSVFTTICMCIGAVSSYMDKHDAGNVFDHYR